VPSVSTPGRELIVEVEVNVSERTPKNDLQRLPFSFESGGKTLTTAIVSYEINEMLGTKMRALFQRKKRRDLFDLYWALTVPTAMSVRPKDMIAAFQHYMRDEKTVVPRAEFLAHLNECVREELQAPHHEQQQQQRQKDGGHDGPQTPPGAQQTQRRWPGRAARVGERDLASDDPACQLRVEAPRGLVHQRGVTPGRRASVGPGPGCASACLAAR